MEPKDYIAIGALAIGVLGFLFGLYKHFTTRKYAGLAYEVSQLSDYDVPATFLMNLSTALVAIKVESTGNKLAENLDLRVRTKSDVTSYDVDPIGLPVTLNGSDVSLKVEKLNPSQRITIRLYCSGAPTDDQIDSIRLTHSEGEGVNKRSASFTLIDFRFLGMGFTYNLLTREFGLTLLGPWQFRK